MYSHVKQECRLYIPFYEMAPERQIQYLSIGTKTKLHEDVDVSVIKVEAGKGISGIITASQSRLRRLIVVPMLAAHTTSAGNAVPNAQESCLTTELSTCSPNFIQNYQVYVGQQGHYTEDMEFKYMNYLHEMNGNYSINSNMVTGASASLISQVDWNNNYGDEKDKCILFHLNIHPTV